MISKKRNNYKNYNIFISYRGNSHKGQVFAKQLYTSIENTPGFKNLFGEVYYSPSESIGNFRNDIKVIMKHIKYFIIPFDKNYFEDFLTYGGSNNRDSITRLELKEALKAGCKFFIPVSLDGTDFDSIKLKSIFSKYNKITCAKRSFYIDENLEESEAINELVYQVCEAVYLHQKRKYITQSSANNICLQFKRGSESSEQSLNVIGSKNITFVNLAGTSFLTGTKIAASYSTQNWLQSWFTHAVKTGELSVTVILTAPDSAAAKDAENYKMYPRETSIPKTDIIIENLERLLELKAIFKKAKVHIYLNDIAMPYAIQIVEFNDSSKNYAKIDLYAPLLASDDQRPVFHVDMSKNNQEMFRFFRYNADMIISNAKKIKLFEAKNYWLYKSPIAHRAIINTKYNPMTKGAFTQCIEKSIPIEVDVIKLTDNKFFVGRDLIVEFKRNKKKISEMNSTEFLEYRDSIADVTGKILLLDEFITHINKQVPVLFEIKSNMSIITETTKSDNEAIGNEFISALKDYEGEYAVCSSNPFLMKTIKQSGIKAKCGQITLDMSTILGIDDEIIELHKNNKYMSIWQDNKPDFILCRIEDINKKRMMCFCYLNNIPLLGWGEAADKGLEISKCCVNVVKKMNLQ